MKSARWLRNSSCVSWWKRLTVATLMVRFIRSTWPLIQRHEPRMSQSSPGCSLTCSIQIKNAAVKLGRHVSHNSQSRRGGFLRFHRWTGGSTLWMRPGLVDCRNSIFESRSTNAEMSSSTGFSVMTLSWRHHRR
jgi:hypothetical protein